MDIYFIWNPMAFSSCSSYPQSMTDIRMRKRDSDSEEELSSHPYSMTDIRMKRRTQPEDEEEEEEEDEDEDDRSLLLLNPVSGGDWDR